MIQGHVLEIELREEKIQIELHNIKGEDETSNHTIFNIVPNEDVLWRYIDMQLTNGRAGTASAKTREVSVVEGSLIHRSTPEGETRFMVIQ